VSGGSDAGVGSATRARSHPQIQLQFHSRVGRASLNGDYEGGKVVAVMVVEHAHAHTHKDSISFTHALGVLGRIEHGFNVVLLLTRLLR
jgi:hypothetical protein